MCNIYSSILYSEFNYELAYDLKKICRQEDICIMNTVNFADFVFMLSQNNYRSVFIDCNTVELSKNLIELLKDYKKLTYSAIVFIDGVNIPAHQRFFRICSENLRGDLINIKDACESLHKRKYAIMDVGDVHEYVISYLKSFGLAPKLRGFNYIKDLVMYGMSQEGIHKSLSKELYPMVAIKNNTTVASVERNIRSAIQIASNSDKFVCIKNDLGDTPTNRMFLDYVIKNFIDYIDKLEK